MVYLVISLQVGVGMTHREKIDLMKSTIVFLYEKEGRSKSYISKLLGVERSTLSAAINSWGLVKADIRHLTPSSQKFLNKHRKKILDMLDSNATINEIASSLGIGRKSLLDTYIKRDKELLHHYNLLKSRKADEAANREREAKERSSREYDSPDISGEVWKDILGYPNYQVSNMGRVRGWAKRYKSYYIIKPQENVISGRMYVTLRNEAKTANLSLPRLVAFAFVPGQDADHNTVDHKDGDVKHNWADNLEWVSQSENLFRSYQNGRQKSRAYSKNGKFRKIVLDDTYEFSSIAALSRFLGVSEVQASRYISGESKTDRKIRLVS